MHTALCIVPPEGAWDTLQRARHVARDKTYHMWPPSIRLFHPFCHRSELSNVALEVAQVVEKYNIEPFEVVLDTWTVIPHMEALEADLDALQQIPTQEEHKQVVKGRSETDKLIEQEEQVGKQRLQRRVERNRNKKGAAPSSTEKAAASAEDVVEKESPRSLLEKQKRMYEEFNGPCVVCLEPDLESRERLVELRELLREEVLASYDGYSPSSSLSDTDSLPRAVTDNLDSFSYRPLVSVGSFPTVTSAIETARKLKGLWQPLAFNVTDFHFISHEIETAADSMPNEDFTDNREYLLRKTSWMKDHHEERTLTTSGQYGCDALVQLVGEEFDIDEEGSKEDVDLILSQGSPGGYGFAEEEPSGLLRTISNEDTEENGGNLEEWLDSDEGWDEGSVVVIGRTHFFSGEMRVYVGMPASSVVDAKDRSLGDSISASARRRGTVHRQMNVWKDGEFGRRESDFVP